MEASTWERRGILMGVVAAILTVIGFIIAGSGSPDFLDKPQEIANYYTDDSGRIIVGSYIGLLSTAALIWFIGELRARMRRHEDGSGRLTNIAFGGGLVAAAMFLLVDLTNLAAAMRADEDNGILPATAATLNDVSNLALGTGALALSVLALAVAAHAFRTGMLPRWLAWATIAMALVALTPWSFIAAFISLPWVVTVAVVLYLRDAPATVADTTSRPLPA